MTAPDAREWHRIDPAEPMLCQQQRALADFEAAHPGMTFGRMTLLGIDRGEPWLCIDGWRTPPDDQGPAPTDDDIPMRGFV